MSIRLTLGGLAALSLATVAAAGPEWVEGGEGGLQGDAGPLPGTAQATVGIGQLGSISGALGDVGVAGDGFDDVDMYLIQITDPGPWFASVLPENGGQAAGFNPSLWLFDVTGLGLLGNEVFFTKGATAGGGDGKTPNLGDAKLLSMSDDGLTILTDPGTYLIAITENGNVCVSKGGEMFAFDFFGEISGPDGPGGGQPIANWTNDLAQLPEGDGSSLTGGPPEVITLQGDYRIVFFGTGFESVGGACCLPDDTCVVTGLGECDALGGDYQGDGVNCGTVGYEAQDSASAFEDISGSGTEAPNASNSDDAGDIVPLGFTFNFFGVDHTEIAVASNGYLTFGADLSDFTNDPIPSVETPNDLIAPFWDDLSPNNGGSVHYQTLGAAPNRRFIAQWTQVPEFSDTGANTFQAVLFEGTNCIEFRYDVFSADLSGDDVTVGIEGPLGLVGLAIDTSTISVGDAIEICPIEVVDPCDEPLVVELPVDVKPGSCVNPFNPSSNGVLKVGLLGTDEADGNDVDLSTVVISRADGVGGAVGPNEGPPGPSSKIKHVGSPAGGSDPCECDSTDDDAYVDVELKFPSSDMADELQLDGLPGGTQVELVVSGLLDDGTPFEGHGCVWLVPIGGIASVPEGTEVTANVPLTWVETTPVDFWYDEGGFPPFIRHWNPGETVELFADPIPGRRFLGWRIDGDAVIIPLPVITIDADQVESVEAVYTQPRGMSAPPGSSN